MKSAPIHSGAIRPQGRKRHALNLLRLVVIAGFALAGWMALAALTDSATAHASEVAGSGPAAAWPTEAPADARSGDGPLDGEGFAAPRPVDARTVLDGASRDAGVEPMREVEAWGRGLPGQVQEVRERPVHFLQKRRHEVFDRKDRAVEDVRKLADAAGLPRVRLTDVRSDVPIVNGLVREIADAQPAPHQDLPSDAQDQSAAGDETKADGEAPDGAVAAPHAQPSPAASGAGDEEPGHCAGCQGDQDGPAPVAPSGNDGPRASGGQSFVPVADLQHGLRTAAPAAVETRTFHRTALTDVSAPGGPSVVPD